MSERDIQDRRNVDPAQDPTPIENDHANDSAVDGTRETREIRETTSRADDGFLPDDRMKNLQARWDDVQAGFVDDPRASVQQAHALVQSTVDDLTATFSKERDSLEGQWNGGDVDTEALRVALRRYRAFFNRLLAR